MKTKTILLFSLLFLLSSFNQLSAQDFYLHANGVTCMCPDAVVGDSGIVNGITYTKRIAIQITTTNAPTTCTSGITDMSEIFYGESNFNEDISTWDVSNVTTMSLMFKNAISFNQNIGNWNVSNVINMHSMFSQATSFNQNIGNWDVSNVLWMYSMFHRAESFNQDIGNWDVSSVNYMGEMFYQSYSFNQDIGNWDVSIVNNMYHMFGYATAFNQDIGNWDVSNVKWMHSMFQDATSYNQNISDWQFRTNVTLNDFISNSGLGVANYEALLQSFDEQNLMNKTLGSDALYYCDDTFRSNLTNNKGWTISGDTNLQTGTGIFISCIGDTARGSDEIENTYTVIGNEFDPAAYFCDDSFTMTNDYNNMPTLDGAIFNEGTHTIIWTATTANNDTSTCSFVLEVIAGLATVDFNIASIVLYPNPTNNIVRLSNPQAIALESLLIFDLTGRLIEKTDLNAMGTEISIDVSKFSSGTYLAIIKSANKGSVSKQLVVIN